MWSDQEQRNFGQLEHRVAFEVQRRKSVLQPLRNPANGHTPTWAWQEQVTFLSASAPLHTQNHAQIGIRAEASVASSHHDWRAAAARFTLLLSQLPFRFIVQPPCDRDKLQARRVSATSSTTAIARSRSDPSLSLRRCWSVGTVSSRTPSDPSFSAAQKGAAYSRRRACIRCCLIPDTPRRCALWTAAAKQHSQPCQVAAIPIILVTRPHRPR